MCGIVGYVGGTNAAPILMDGLRRLEYRGYDSAGVAVIHDGRLEVRRSVGKIAALERVLAREPLEGRLGVAHTRWATHGRPCDQNAHPHRDCSKSVAVVHNGIIENHAHLRKALVLDDGEMAVLSGEGVRVVRLDGRTVHKAVATVPWDNAAAEKDGHPHFMLKEIHEQPRALETTLRALGDLDGALGLDREALRRIDRVAMVACGTSWHAALIGKYMVETLCRIPVDVDIASEYRYLVPLDKR